ncbi:MAG: phosphotransferase family protein [Anaerolineae bacterium]|nr:phosphotransferase family protein [Anaerolineae bacterium]
MTDALDFQQRLSAYLTEASGAPATVTHAAPLAGGASRDMWLIDAEVGGEALKLVLRRDSPTTMLDEALTREQEFGLMQAAHADGIRVARPRWLCTDVDVLGAPFFLMDYVPGIAIGRKVVQAPELAEARALLPAQMAEQLGKIHALDYRAHGIDFLPEPAEGHTPIQDAIDQARGVLDALQIKHPAFEFALRWAEQNAPSSERLTVIHGDFRIGNLIVNANGLAAIADWEFSHIGDPLEELGYCCMRDWRFGVRHLRLGGVGDREPFLQAYERIAGTTIDRQAVDYWECLGNVRWGIICLAQANRHLSGHEPSVELASLGRRSAEMQYEMLRLIEQMGI